METYTLATKQFVEEAIKNIDVSQASHQHNASDISSGTLPINRGGTGASDAKTARENLGAAFAADVPLIMTYMTAYELPTANIIGDKDSLNPAYFTREAVVGDKFFYITKTKDNDICGITAEVTQILESGYVQFEVKDLTLITSGVTPIDKGGTGAKDVATARTNLGITPTNIGAATTSHTHDKSQITDFAHTHDDRYYAAGEIDNKLSAKAESSHGNHVPATQTANSATFLRNDNTWQKVTPANIGAVPTSRKVNGKALSGDISLGASDVGADASGSASAVQTNLNNHTGNKSNPHGVTKEQIGLGNVDNISTMTVLSGFRAELDTHVAKTNNPHNVTAAQIGAPTIEYGSYTGGTGSGNVVLTLPFEAKFIAICCKDCVDTGGEYVSYHYAEIFAVRGQRDATCWDKYNDVPYIITWDGKSITFTSNSSEDDPLNCTYLEYVYCAIG